MEKQVSERKQKYGEVMYIRVLGDERLVEEMATRIGEYLEGEGYELLDQSGAVPSPYKVGEAKVILTVR
jgi:hypothetical protein